LRYTNTTIPKGWRLGRLARRLIVLLALGAIIPMAISMTLSVMSFTSAQSGEIQRRQVEVAKRTALTISNLLQSPKDQLLLLSSAGDFSSPEGRQRAATDALKANQGIESVYIVGADGRELLRSDRYQVFDVDELRNVGDSAYFRVTQSGKTYIGPVTFSRFREPVVEIAVPLRELRNNDVWGALAVRFNLKVMWDVLARTDVGDTGYAYVLDSKGRLIGHPDPSLVLGDFDASAVESVRYVLQMTGMHGRADGSTSGGLLGAKVLFSHSTIAQTGWIAIVETPTSEAFAAARANVMRAIVVVALTLLGAGVFAVVMGKRFVKPIRELTESARQISAGDLSPLISVRGDDEVGQLAESFRLMVGKLKGAFSELENTVTELKGREAELKTLNESLEERVAERTRELSQANQELEVEVTERRQAEEALEHKAQELVRSNSELEQFAYVASHDLQEPLRKIQSFGDLLTSKSGDALNDQGRDYLDRMKGAASRMRELITGLLTFSRVTTQAQPHTHVDLRDVTQGVLSDLEVRIQESGGRVEVGNLPVVDADPLQMRMLMQNLISNALKFQKPEEPPLVKVESRFISSTNGTGGQQLGEATLCELTVQDNGIGFDEKYADRIFGIFQRLHGRGAYEGTGIGLATCRKIAERHGGSITARSRPGEGASFVVTLPIKQRNGEGLRWTDPKDHQRA